MLFNANTEEQVQTDILHPDLKLDEDLKEEILSEMIEEGMVIVHCAYTPKEDGLVRIWVTTFLIDKATGERSRLVHAENITFAPYWTIVPQGSTHRFTLIFAPLPKECMFFDLLEDIPQSGGFFIQNIKRNKQDVYHVKVT